MRGVIGAVAGFLVMLIVEMTGTALLVTYFAIPRGGTPTQGYLAANVVLSFFAAYGAGSIAGIFARPNTRVAVGILVALLVGTTLISLTGDHGREPIWYLVAVALIGILGVVLGARNRQHRYSPPPVG